jgi:hypothetical protein
MNNGLVFDFAAAPAITGASLDPSSTFHRFERLTSTPSSFAMIDLTFAPTTATPEPQFYALLLAGLGVTGAILPADVRAALLHQGPFRDRLPEVTVEHAKPVSKLTGVTVTIFGANPFVSPFYQWLGGRRFAVF